MNLKNANFVLSSVTPATFIRDGKPQIAFAGRSNVGKSSVINKLLDRKNFARVGSAPGKTVHINYFDIDEKLYFVDLPGYGFAKVSKQTRSLWQKLIESYLTNNDHLCCVVVIIDARHEITELDLTMLQWLNKHRIPPIVIATKADKLSSNKLNNQLNRNKEIVKDFGVDDILPFSSFSGFGKKQVWDKVSSYLAT